MKFSTKKYLKDRSKSKTYGDWIKEVGKDRLRGSKMGVELFRDDQN